MFWQRIRARGGRDPYGYAPPVGATLVAGVSGGLYDGYNNNGLLSGAWGSLSNTSAPGGEVITGMHWSADDVASYLVIAGSGKMAWFSGRTITINGTQYTCTGAASFADDTYGIISTTQLFVNGNSYSIVFP